jgi:Ca2+-binding RTX toxin-like protein
MGDDTNETNLLMLRASETGFLQDVVGYLNEYGVNEKDALLIGASLCDWAYSVGEKILDEGEEKLAFPLKFLTKQGPIVAGIINVVELGATPKALALTAASFLVSSAGVGGGILASVVASIGGGVFAVLGAEVLVGVGVGLAVDYLVGEAWDTFIGPNAELIVNHETKDYSFTVSGKLSDFLEPRGTFWQGVNAILDLWPGDDNTASNVWEKFDLANANRWSLKAADVSGEPLVISYKSDSGFTFSGVSGSFRDIYNSRIDGDRYSFSSEKEHTTTINLILENYGRDFDVTTSTGNDHVYNLVVKTEDELYALATSANETVAKRTLLALDLLRCFALESEAGLSEPINTDEYSDQYIQDRARFLYHSIHEDALSSDGTDITFVDKTYNITLEVGNGSANPLTDEKYYLFGEDDVIAAALGKDTSFSNDVLQGEDNEDHLYGMGGDDSLKGFGGADYLEGGLGRDTMDGGQVTILSIFKEKMRNMMSSLEVLMKIKSWVVQSGMLFGCKISRIPPIPSRL